MSENPIGWQQHHNQWRYHFRLGHIAVAKPKDKYTASFVPFWGDEQPPLIASDAWRFNQNPRRIQYNAVVAYLKSVDIEQAKIEALQAFGAFFHSAANELEQETGE